MHIFQRNSIFTFFLLIGSYVLGQAQINISVAEQIQEKFEIVTDRDIYCVGENIQFAIYNISPRIIRENNWSSVIYVELIKYDGDVIAQQKIKLDNWGGGGNIVLPESILSGNYYLRVYTRWMRNFSHTNFAYHFITVVNPFNNLPLVGDTSISSLFDIKPKDYVQTEQKNILLNKSSYQQRESIAISVNKYITENKIISPVSIAVANANSYNNYKLIKKNQEANPLKQIRFLSEPNGLTISGKVIDLETNEPVPYANVKMTILNKNKEQPIVLTNEEGRFYIELPNSTGSNEIFASVSSNLNDRDLKLLIDNDFCTTPIRLPYIALYNDSVQYQLLNRIAHNFQIQKIYTESEHIRINDTNLNQLDSLPFYGSSTQTIRLDQYIPLPTLSDYFNELLPQVRIVNTHKKTSFKILGDESELNIYPPIVMIDRVVISDNKWLLSLSPEKIDRIEVVDKPYYYGNLIHGGIISLFSKDGDFAGKHLSESGLFFNYGFFNIPCNNRTNANLKHIPELNNTLCWKLIDGANSNAFVSFSAGDIKGRYVIKITGVNSNGNLINEFTFFNVE